LYVGLLNGRRGVSDHAFFAPRRFGARAMLSRARLPQLCIAELTVLVRCTIDKTANFCSTRAAFGIGSRTSRAQCDTVMEATMKDTGCLDDDGGSVA
jgi:hypothetical protein